MRKFIKNNIKFILGTIIGLVLSGLGVYALTVTAGQITYDNTQSGIQANNVSDAIDKLYEKAETSSVSNCPKGYTKINNGYGYECNGTIDFECPSGYNLYKTDSGYKCLLPTRPICIRATTLHTETCKQGDNCYADGYYAGGSKGTTTITYGQLGTQGSEPVPGDAFDCDVDGNGIYDSQTERFYYISKYFDTSTKTFNDDDTYVFMHAGGTSTVYWFSSTTTSSGPVTVRNRLPTTSNWKEVSLKTTTRNILKGSSITSIKGTAISNFSYEGYSARLLTVQELKSACPDASTTNYSMSSCNYFFENTAYANSSSRNNYSLWLESVCDSSTAWGIGVNMSLSCYLSTQPQVSSRSVIDVPKSKILY